MCTNLKTAKILSETKLQELQKELTNAFNETDFDKSFLDNVCVYACGSLARNELVKDSDLDLFFINNSERDISKLNTFNFFSRLHKIQKELGFKDPSKGGHFWSFTSQKNLLDIGSQVEDYNNSLTARLLLLLESKPIFNETLYDEIVDKAVNLYFKDYEKHKTDFTPMYLINDILRYWYTLTLNYEFRRDNNDTVPEKCWKRLKLKYARLLTCFSFVACLFENEINQDKVKEIIKKTPLERLEQISKINDDIKTVISNIKTKYEWFLSLKNEQPTWWDTNGNKELAVKNAEGFHNEVVHTLMGKIYNTNSELRNKLDF